MMKRNCRKRLGLVFRGIFPKILKKEGGRKNSLCEKIIRFGFISPILVLNYFNFLQ